MWRTPNFWYDKDSFWPYPLSPLSLAYRGITHARAAWTRPYKAAAPVVCIGNCVMGGAGKTPIAIMLAKLLIDKGHKPWFVTRGYGASLKGPLQADPSIHTANDVGDEALLLAAVAPTIVATNRIAGLQAACAQGATLIIVDDGFQNPSFAKDCAIVAIDQQQTLGNGFVFPAGPLREPYDRTLQRSHAILWMGPDSTEFPYPTYSIPAFHGALTPVGDAHQRFESQPVIAFCGLGFPQKFFTTLASLGSAIVATHSFPDHHPYTNADIAELKAQAQSLKARLVTTEKDWVRLPYALRAGIDVLKVEAHIDDADKLIRHIESHLSSKDFKNSGS